METRTQWLERMIRECLAETRWKEQPITMLALFTAITSVKIETWPTITASDFNKAVGDLRKVGIVETSRGNLIYLSDDAWNLVRHQFPPKVSAPVAAPKINARNPFGAPEVQS